MDGWIKLHRKLNDTSFKTKPLVVALFIDLLINANHKEKKFLWNKEELTIKEGQFITGRKELAKQTGISEQSIRTGLTTLKSTNTITIKSTSKFSLISIVNWVSYQGQPTSRSTKELTNNQPTTNQQLTTNKNVIMKECKNNNITKVMTKPSGFGNQDINYLVHVLKDKLKLPLLDGSQEQNRRYAQLLLKKFGGKDKVALIIEGAARNPFWSTKITSFQGLYYKSVQIISDSRNIKGGVVDARNL